MSAKCEKLDSFELYKSVKKMWVPLDGAEVQISPSPSDIPSGYCLESREGNDAPYMLCLSFSYQNDTEPQDEIDGNSVYARLGRNSGRVYSLIFTAPESDADDAIQRAVIEASIAVDEVVRKQAETNSRDVWRRKFNAEVVKHLLPSVVRNISFVKTPKL